MKKWHGVVVAFLFVCIAANAQAQQNRSGLTTEEKQLVDQTVTRFMEENEVVGVAVGILIENKIAYLKGYGKANREMDVPVTTETIFNWASNSKPVVAVLAMQLVEKGKLDLDADVRKYVPELPSTNAPYTVRHLLCHQSGYPHYSNGTIRRMSGRVDSPDEELDPAKSILRFGNSPLIDRPGNRYSYSSYAYVILSLVVQRAGEQPIAEQLATRITSPIDLNSFQLDLPRADQPNWATGYARGRSGQVFAVRDTAHFWKHGAGGYKSNIKDFAAWAEALLNHRLVSEELTETMWTAQSTNNGKLTTYGLGFGVRRRNGVLEVGHSGSQDETKTHMKIYPDQGSGMVVLSNSTHITPLTLISRIEKALTQYRSQGRR